MTLEAQSAASNEELEDLILSCRYGDLEDVRDFVGRHGVAALDDYLDEYGNSCLHMAAANGHEDVVQYLLENLEKPSSLHRANLPPASNTPLHWAAMNHHLSILKLLCPRLTTEQICQVNGRGMSAMSEAMGSISNNLAPSEDKHPPSATAQETNPEPHKEQIPLREQCVNYLVEMMKLGDADTDPQENPSVDDPPKIPHTSNNPHANPVDSINIDMKNTQLDDRDTFSSVKALR